MPSLAQGVVKFQREVFPEKAELFEKLSTGQSPEALFITCSDSRIAPSVAAANHDDIVSFHEKHPY
jgi:carbonic anhydrase